MSVNLPLGITTSAGQDEELPVQTSCTSQLTSLEGRHTVVAGAKVHWLVQHALFSGSHCALPLNLHVATSQHVELEPMPGSQSSPFSTMPFPHIWREMV